MAYLFHVCDSARVSPHRASGAYPWSGRSDDSGGSDHKHRGAGRWWHSGQPLSPLLLWQNAFSCGRRRGGCAWGRFSGLQGGGQARLSSLPRSGGEGDRPQDGGGAVGLDAGLGWRSAAPRAVLAAPAPPSRLRHATSPLPRNREEILLTNPLSYKPRAMA